MADLCSVILWGVPARPSRIRGASSFPLGGSDAPEKEFWMTEPCIVIPNVIRHLWLLKGSALQLPKKEKSRALYRLLHVKTNMSNFTISNDIILPLQSKNPVFLAFGERTPLRQIFPEHHFRPDKSLFEVRMD